MPRPDPAATAIFRSLVPEAPGVSLRPMFGQPAAFVNGNLFSGLFGDALFVRVDGEGRESLLAAGGSVFEPMRGRPMRAYTCLAQGWRSDPEAAGEWVGRALAHTAALPPKTAAARARGGTKAGR